MYTRNQTSYSQFYSAMHENQNAWLIQGDSLFITHSFDHSLLAYPPSQWLTTGMASLQYCWTVGGAVCLLNCTSLYHCLSTVLTVTQVEFCGTGREAKRFFWHDTESWFISLFSSKYCMLYNCLVSFDVNLGPIKTQCYWSLIM